MNRFLVVCCVGVCVGISGCTPRIGGQDFSVSDSGQMATTYRGVVISLRPVMISNKRPEAQGEAGSGATIGAVTGGVAAGSTMGRGNGALAAGVLGAVVGGVAGHYAEKELSRQEGVEYTIRLEDGRTVSIAQGKEPVISMNQSVIVVEGSERTRVVPA